MAEDEAKDTPRNDPQETVPDEALTSEVAELKDQLLRLQADFQNFKRRSTEDQVTSVATARLSVLLAFLPVIDNFERAFADVPKEIEKSNWYGGVTAIKKQFEQILASLGIKRIASVGKAFDPELHEAITHEASDKFAADVVSEEFEAGYKAGGDVIRHARVKVSNGKK